MMQVRRIILEDELAAITPAIKTFAEDWIKDDLFWSANSLLQSLDGTSHDLWVSQEPGGSWVGLCVMKRVVDETELLYIHIHSQFRGRGYARELLDCCLNDLEIQGCTRAVFLEVRPSNLFAINLYRSCGFIEVSRRLKYYKDGEDAVIMQRLLFRDK